MSLLVNAMSIAHYTRMANNAAYSMMKINSSRMDMISSMGTGMDFGSSSLENLAALDTQLEIDALTSGLQYKFAKAMLEQLKQQQKEDVKSFSTFA